MAHPRGTIRVDGEQPGERRIAVQTIGWDVAVPRANSSACFQGKHQSLSTLAFFFLGTGAFQRFPDTPRNVLDESHFFRAPNTRLFLIDVERCGRAAVTNQRNGYEERVSIAAQVLGLFDSLCVTSLLTTVTPCRWRTMFSAPKEFSGKVPAMGRTPLV